VSAEVAYGFDAETLIVWLDTFDPAFGLRSGVLCRRHADAMVVPLGWMLDDRREPVPRLFSAARMTDLTDAMARPRQRRARADRTIEMLRTAAMQLTLEDMGAGGSPDGEIIEAGPRQLAVVSDETMSFTRPDPIEPERIEPERLEDLVAETDLGAEVEAEVETGVAVELAEPTEPDASVAAEQVEPVEGTDDAETDGTDAADTGDVTDTATDTGDGPDAQVLPWQPRFDQNDDLSGLLQARGRLLSRAFRGVAADGA
jgi:hypothetical protein